MTPTFAVADTWGISGSDFLRGYTGLAAALSILAVLLFLRAYRRSGGSGQDSRAVGERLAPADAAYLRGGRSAAVLCAIAGLRARGILLAPGRRKLATSRSSIPGEVSGLERAVHEAVRRREPYRRIGMAPGVRGQLDAVEAKLIDTGLLRSATDRTVLRGFGLAMLAVLAVGIARLVAGIGNQKPVGYLILTLIGFTGVLIWFHYLIRRSHRTRFGNQVLNYLNSRYVHLAPSHHPSWRANGAEAAAMSAAMFGAAAIYASDPAFATRIGVSLSATAASGSSGSYTGSSSGTGCGSGGGDGGGGGGCGGGGCGG